MATISPPQATINSRHRATRLTWISRCLSDLLVPPACSLCLCAISKDHGLCHTCSQALELQQLQIQHTCPRCAHPVGRWLAGPRHGRCSWCDRRPFHLDRSVAVASHRGVARQSVLALKFKNQRCLAAPLAAYMAQRVRAISATIPSPTTIAWVPSHWSRTLRRGYDPAELLGLALANDLGLPVLQRGGLSRQRRTPPLRQLSLGARRRSLEGALQIRPPARSSLAMKPSVLLVDDVLTTGATLSACARLLREAGAKWVVGVVVTRRLLSEPGRHE